MKESLILDSDKRFAYTLGLAAAIHLFVLIGLEVLPQEVLPLTQIAASVLDVTLNVNANQHSPEIALNIAPQNNDSPFLNANDNDDLTLASHPSLAQSAKHPANLPANHLQPNESAFKTDEYIVNPSEKKADKLTNDRDTPRRRTISAASHESRDAAYLAKWQNYVEEYGNKHYPSGALKHNLKGNLRLLVAVKKDGSLHEVSLRQSSGSAILDQAAIDIVTRAAPFEPLPAEIAKDTEILEIIRTWQFRGSLTTKG